MNLRVAGVSCLLLASGIGLVGVSCAKKPSAATPPVAAFTVQPSSGPVTTTFAVDASGSSDAEDVVTALQVRWDWDNNGSWDTAFSPEKTATHAYATAGVKAIRCEVRDTAGLTSSATRQVTVTDSGQPAQPAQYDILSNTGQVIGLITYDPRGYPRVLSIDRLTSASAYTMRALYDADGCLVHRTETIARDGGAMTTSLTARALGNRCYEITETDSLDSYVVRTVEYSSRGYNQETRSAQVFDDGTQVEVQETLTTFDASGYPASEIASTLVMVAGQPTAQTTATTRQFTDRGNGVYRIPFGDTGYVERAFDTARGPIYPVRYTQVAGPVTTEQERAFDSHGFPAWEASRQVYNGNASSTIYSYRRR